jgi:hypothetical protein
LSCPSFKWSSLNVSSFYFADLADEFDRYSNLSNSVPAAAKIDRPPSRTPLSPTWASPSRASSSEKTTTTRRKRKTSRYRKNTRKERFPDPLNRSIIFCDAFSFLGQIVFCVIFLINIQHTVGKIRFISVPPITKFTCQTALFGKLSKLLVNSDTYFFSRAKNILFIPRANTQLFPQSLLESPFLARPCLLLAEPQGMLTRGRRNRQEL